MTEHDQLCDWHPSRHTDWTCECDLIARARAAERRRLFAKCFRCGEPPKWDPCLNLRCTAGEHPWCGCDRGGEVDGHWCDEGCPPSAEAEAEIRADERDRLGFAVENLPVRTLDGEHVVGFAEVFDLLHPEGARS